LRVNFDDDQNPYVFHSVQRLSCKWFTNHIPDVYQYIFS